MTTQVLPKDRSLSKFVAHSKTLDNFCRTVLLKKLSELNFGKLQINEASSTYELGVTDSDFVAKINILSSSFWSRTLFGGSIGIAESYVDQDWECDSLPDLIRLFVRNRNVVQGLDTGLASLILRPIQKMFHGLRANTIQGSRENIRAHYDMGNDFFKLFLDKTMMYSSAVFKTADTPLEEASINKLKLICDKLHLKASDHLVEIGTGWGSMAIFAAQNYGCKVTTTTISQEQFKYAQERIKELSLENQITLLLEDYRNLTGKFDKLVSVEMIEAVGLDNLPYYFEKCSTLLKDDGLMVIQAITIRDQFYDEAKRSVDFIQRHIFPGSGIPSVSAMTEAMKHKTDLILIGSTDYAEDYAQTLSIWSKNLKANESEIIKLGYPSFLYRLWQFYFAYCEGGFRERAIGVSQMTFAKPLYKERSYL